MFFTKKKQPTLVEQAVTAVDRIFDEMSDLRDERDFALSSFRRTADRLEEINDELEIKASLCRTLQAQLADTQENIEQHIQDNESVRLRILDIIGE